MQLRGIDFGHVLDASGVRGFFGEGYPHHRPLRKIGLDFTGATFVAKTTTLCARTGNMPLRTDLAPRELKPKCIIVKPFDGVVLNAVGLSGPGAEALLADGRWQQRTSPFFLSFMSVAPNEEERRGELKAFVRLLRRYITEFHAPIGLQLNFSCPNVGVQTDHLIQEITTALTAADTLGIPLMPKLAVTIPLEVALKVAHHPACDALCISNTIPWGAMPDRINWKKLFGSATSPLEKFGGGGLSGAPLLPLVFEWVTNARAAGLTCPLNAGGGILAPNDAEALFDAGADSVFIGSMAILRPWRVRATIRHASVVGERCAAEHVQWRKL